MSFGAFLQSLAVDANFRELFLEQIRAAPFAAFQWETPPLTEDNLEQPFECLLHDNPALDVPANSTDFKGYFQGWEQIVTFDNLGGDALLIVPCPISKTANYSHIAAFHRSAPIRQQHAFWKTVAHAVQERLSSKPVWLNTAGGGVDWLHMRLDARPKYYRHLPWRNGLAGID